MVEERLLGDGGVRNGLFEFMKRLQPAAETAFIAIGLRNKTIVDYTTDLSAIVAAFNGLSLNPPPQSNLTEGILDIGKALREGPSGASRHRRRRGLGRAGGRCVVERSAQSAPAERRHDARGDDRHQPGRGGRRRAWPMRAIASRCSAMARSSQAVGASRSRRRSPCRRALQQIAGDLSAQYIIQYTLPDGVKPDRRLNVSLKRARRLDARAVAHSGSVSARSPPTSQQTRTVPTMISFLKTRLSAMMFLQYVIWGAWYVTLNTYLTSTLKFSGTEAGAVFGTTAIASLVAPFLVGLVADRWFATERVLATLYALGAVFLLLATQVTSFGAVYMVMLAVCLCYFPTIALTNAITMQQVADPGRDFPRIRMLGTIGWIVINLVVGFMRIEPSAMPFVLGAAACVVMAAYSLMALPAHAAARDRAEGDAAQRARARRARDAEGLELPGVRHRVGPGLHPADVLLLVYQRVSQRGRCDQRRREDDAGAGIGDRHDAGDAVRLSHRHRARDPAGRTAVVGGAIRAAGLRQIPGPAIWMFYLAIILHGVCFDFFFVTGQLYTDQQAPPHLRSTAQGFITAMTYGFGMFIGSFLSGYVLDYFSTTGADGTVMRDWTAFWLTSARMSFAIMLLVFFFFRTTARIRAKEA